MGYVLSFITFLFFIGSSSCTTYEDRVTGRLASSKAGQFKVETLQYSKEPDLKGDLFLPERGSNFPIVIMIHGGGWARGHRNQMTAVAERFVNEGFAVFNVSYRFAPKHNWPAQRNDIEAALAFIVKNADSYSLDVQNITAFGYSAGAHLALLLAYHPDRKKPGSVRLKAVAGGGSPVDLTAWPEGELVVDFIGHPYKTHKHLYVEASPITYATTDSPPTFLYHGQHDWIVDASQSQLLVKKLESLGVEVKLYEPFFGHVNTFLFDSKETAKVIKFFKKHID